MQHVDYSQLLSEKDKSNFIQGPGDVEWKYEMRRECQMILPGLWLGPFQISKDKTFLSKLGITHIVCIRDLKEAFSVKPRFPEEFIYLTLDVQDNEEQNLIRLFPSARQFIDNAIHVEKGQVLVHCNGGISLSPTFVVMYVMHTHQLSWEDALHMVQNRRYCISPNGGFLTQLKEYEAIYRASIAVSSYAPAIERTVSRRKREDDEDDEDIERQEERKRVLVESDPMQRQMKLSARTAAAMASAPPPQSSHDPNAMEIS